jgi:hypothetical protein
MCCLVYFINYNTYLYHLNRLVGISFVIQFWIFFIKFFKLIQAYICPATS